jgi:predicted nucleic acid-binding Zn ribbon protein
MRYRKTQSIGEVLKLYIQAFQIDNKLTEMQLIKRWRDMVGPNINAYTRDIKVFNKVLFVYTKSAVMRNELNFRKEELKIQLWEKVGKENLSDIVFK